MAVPELPTHPDVLTSFPTPNILLITINRPAAMNSVSSSMHTHLHNLFTIYDYHPSLHCAIITGSAQTRSPCFSAGADLKEWLATSTSGSTPQQPPSGFMGLSQRIGKKPVIAAVNGLCYGGGFEAVVGGCDLVVADPRATFAFPEAARGVVAIAGALPRFVRAVGWQRASMVCLGGVVLKAEEARQWGVVGWVSAEGGAVEKALEVAKVVGGLSPDSVIVTREGLRSGVGGEGVVEATRRVREGVYGGLERGENVKEGLRAFVEKRETRWVDSKL